VRHKQHINTTTYLYVFVKDTKRQGNVVAKDIDRQGRCSLYVSQQKTALSLHVSQQKTALSLYVSQQKTALSLYVFHKDRCPYVFQQKTMYYNRKNRETRQERQRANSKEWERGKRREGGKEEVIIHRLLLENSLFCRTSSLL